jgi:hypothetical protein
VCQKGLGPDTLNTFKAWISMTLIRPGNVPATTGERQFRMTKSEKSALITELEIVLDF